ncbi:MULTISPECIES: chitinase [unclassified Streptomyces]|uniref:chitinase n=1 Tax=unclassified Streptomyces TaxID=2593676 RepID=UPI002E80A308|nr:chitinase [Streptomyces sp. NBC_00589]WTI36183.1 chitinase [Streptomyces sp. NBC_00775]WUB30142.1 chitinase [Streptomyces sp. NBC_00589]
MSHRPLATMAATALAAGCLWFATAPEGEAASSTTLAGGLNGPYLYLGWGDPPSPTKVMSATGITQFTLAFMLSDGTCTPKWDGERRLTGGTDAAAIKAIRKAGGDVTVSFGGAGGAKLGEKCGSVAALAAAYQKVVDAYDLGSIDIDIEGTEFTKSSVRKRVVGALKTVKAKNPDLKVYVTFGSGPEGPGTVGTDLVRRAAAKRLEVDGWAVMPFDFEQGETDMVAATKSAVKGLKDVVADAYGISSGAAYREVGFSTMNGVTDSDGETVTVAGFKAMVTYAKKHHLARVSLWSVNRDRSCAAGSEADECSGINQSKYAFTKTLATYTG